MSIEYVIAVFPGQKGREVLVDGMPHGETNSIIMLQAGTHEFSLGGPKDYEPATMIEMVENTTRLDPIQINFTPTRGA